MKIDFSTICYRIYQLCLQKKKKHVYLFLILNRCLKSEIKN